MNAELDQADLIDIYRALHPKSTEYTFFSEPHWTYSKIDHISGNKSLLSKCKRTEIITNSLSDHSTIRLELRIKKHTQIHTAGSNPSETIKQYKKRESSQTHFMRPTSS